MPRLCQRQSMHEQQVTHKVWVQFKMHHHVGRISRYYLPMCYINPLCTPSSGYERNVGYRVYHNVHDPTRSLRLALTVSSSSSSIRLTVHHSHSA